VPWSKRTGRSGPHLRTTSVFLPVFLVRVNVSRLRYRWRGINVWVSASDTIPSSSGRSSHTWGWPAQGHMDQFVVPCFLDGARLPQFLGSAVRLDLRRKGPAPSRELARAVREAPRHANELLPPMRSENPELGKTIRELAATQMKELESMGAGDMRAAARMHGDVDKRLAKARDAWPFEHMLLNIAGYHAKNEYMIKHWGAIQAGDTPKDLLLDRAQRFFFDTLFVDPNDSSAIINLARYAPGLRDVAHGSISARGPSPWRPTRRGGM
jgi:hypothetical protein